MYYNTTNEKGEVLLEYQSKAKNQEEAIMSIMRLGTSFNPNFKTSSSKIDLNAPITSIRRAVTNLINKGLLEYTGEMRTGKYGRPENTFRLSN